MYKLVGFVQMSFDVNPWDGQAHHAVERERSMVIYGREMDWYACSTWNFRNLNLFYFKKGLDEARIYPILRKQKLDLFLVVCTLALH